MICAACGHDNPKANRFCGGCGAPLREPAPRVAEEHSPTRIARNEGLEVELRARVQEAKASERRLLDVQLLIAVMNSNGPLILHGLLLPRHAKRGDFGIGCSLRDLVEVPGCVHLGGCRSL